MRNLASIFDTTVVSKWIVANLRTPPGAAMIDLRSDSDILP